MEENNKKGPGVFYAVVGVATLLVATIGATFAYFSASTSSAADAITGQTNDITGSTLTLDIKQLDFFADGAAGAPTSDLLVPAAFGENKTATEMTDADVRGALNAKCVNNGYTGCHVWKITADTTQNVDSANINLHLGVNANNKAQWSYIVYEGTDTTSGDPAITTAATITNIKTNGAATPANYANTIPTTFPNNEVIDIHNGAALTTAGKVYYVMIFLQNIDSSQNEVSGEPATATSTNATGTYTGQVTLQALNGQVKASFTASQS